VIGTLRDWYRGRRVFVTGHTGFKGAWLVAWLRDMGAEVTGYALAPEPDRPSLFAAARVADDVTSILGDVRDAAALERALAEARPEIVLHLAAQALVRRSYADPIGTYATNVMGTAHLLDAVRRVPTVRAVVVVTSDKCYENRDLPRGYREDDPMGGDDPYSSSKGCAELVTAAMRRSYFAGNVGVASVRAGNVVGGGDWSEDRLVPDLMRAAAAGERALVRRPDAVRPWQFVLEPLRGYLLVARALIDEGEPYAEGWNFGPRDEDAVPVRVLVRLARAAWVRVVVDVGPVPEGPHEAARLELDHTKATERLAWRPVLSLAETIELTVAWYRAHAEDPSRAATLLREQLHAYERRVAAASA
jgi:CDP-glucose 4,6-dehydratase